MRSSSFSVRLWTVLPALLFAAGCTSPANPDGSTSDVRTDSAPADSRADSGAVVDGDTGPGIDVPRMDVPVDNGTTDPDVVIGPDIVKVADAPEPDGSTCPSGQIRCGAVCTDLTIDPANCGACALACPTGQSCAGSACVPTCMTGESLCGTPPACVNQQTSNTNCGACGTVCPAGQMCVTGTCASVCATPLTACTSGGATTCVDLQTDTTNCGSCGMPCAAGRNCVAGVCACPAGQTLCGTTCVNTVTDPANCGACGTMCTAAQTCMASACRTTCPVGQMLCSGTCVNTSTDSANCGACGTACTGGQVCAAGTCACPSGQVTCSGACVDTRTSDTNCGTCGTACTGGTSCSAGVCNCPAGQTSCGGTCTTTGTDRLNCGACGTVCPAATTCTAGVCVCPPGQSLCGSGATASCRNLTNDDSNCGSCGTICGGGSTCMASACTCPPGQRLCTGVCRDTASDNANCGACATVCSGGTSCTAGACACPAGQTLCAGTCRSLQSDNANCGTCGMVCGAGTSCVSSICTTNPPPNDTRATAVLLDLGSTNQSIPANTTSARNDTMGSCACTAGADVFYRFVLTTREIIYADTIGSSFDASLFLQDAAGGNVIAGSAGATCNNDSALCTLGSARDAQIVVALSPGTYYLVLSGCAAGNATIRFQHLPLGSGAVRPITVNVNGGTIEYAGTTTGTTSAITSTCCSGGPEDTLFFFTCPNFPAGVTLNTTTCGTATWDTELDQRSATRAPVSVCNDDSCGDQSRVATTLPAGVGLHTIYVDGCTALGTGSGAYSAGVTFGNCPFGQTLCNSRCVNRLTDSNNCGACGNVCSTGNSCSGGVCRPVNDLCTNPTAITLAATGTTTIPNRGIPVATTTNATTSTDNCSAAGTSPNVFYTFTLARREMVYIDTFGTAFDTVIGVTPATSACGTAAATAMCNDDATGCGVGVTPSQLAVPLNAGTYRIVVSGFAGATGNIVMHIQHIPVSGNPQAALAAGASTFALRSTTGAPNSPNSCGGTAGDHWYYWTTCPASPAGTMSANLCNLATNYLTVLELEHGDGSVRACDLGTCGGTPGISRSLLNAPVPAGAALHVLFVDGQGTSTGTYTLNANRP